MSPPQPLLFATLGAAAAQSMATRRVPRVRSPLIVGTLVLLGALAISLLNARDLSSAGSRTAQVDRVRPAAGGCVRHRGGEGESLAGSRLAGRRCRRGTAGIYQFLFQVGPPGFVLLGRYMRAYGTFAQPNPYGGYLGMLVPLACAVVVTRWRTVYPAPDPPSEGNRTLWWLALAALVTMAAGLLMSWSRGALLGAVVGLVL